MLLPIAWIVLAGECVAAIVFGVVFWRFWSQATISRRVRTVAIVVYWTGCVAILALMFSLPL